MSNPNPVKGVKVLDGLAAVAAERLAAAGSNEERTRHGIKVAVYQAAAVILSALLLESAQRVADRRGG